ncbi:hypothetical protein ML462_00350 [Gramella lutea]|uniref:Uncharacterized protein n=1 Tax=Christiangramia lutea TaxID=1607951 RepID=A0A9X1V278_9FLAO|nr:hypothetical protein [Christiangramia lutea]MCH4821609.1 hypothetical protein [Christiangramia lutea]
MEERYNREDELMKSLLKEAGTEKPSSDFKSKIMLKVESRNTEISPYKPLISKPVWILIGGGVVASILALYLINTDYFFEYDLNFGVLSSIELPRIDLSRTMQIAIAFVALFFLEVPFLKRLMERNYQL